MAWKSLEEVPNYRSMHQIRNYSKCVDFSIYLNEAFNFKLGTDLSFNSRDLESLLIEILFDKRCKTLLNTLCRPLRMFKIRTSINFPKVTYIW